MKTGEIVTYKRTPQHGGRDVLTEILSGGSALAAIAGLLISRVTALGNMAPFGIAWYAATIFFDKYYIILASSILGTLLSGQNVGKIAHICSLLLVLASKHIYKKQQAPGKVAFVAFICTIVTGFISALFSRIFYYSLITCITESLAAGGISVIFLKSACVIAGDKKVSNDEESVAVALLAGCVVAGLWGISIFDIKLANILSMYIILFTAYKGGISISGAVGAALGVIAGISQGDAPALTGVYGFMGLVSGIMNIFGKPGVVISAALANSLFAGYYNSSTIVLVNYLEIATAGIIFFFTPEKALCYLEKFSIRSPVYDAAGGYVMRLKNAVNESMSAIKNSAITISHIYSPPPLPSESGKQLVKSRLIARVCDNCNLNKYCWTKNTAGSHRMFDKITTSLFEENYAEMAGHISGRCVRGEQLASTAKELYNILRRENAVNSRVDFYARAFASGWGDFLEVIRAKESAVSGIKSDYPLLESQLCRELASRGINSPEISIIKNSYGRFEISICSEKEIAFDIIPIAEKITSRKICVTDEYSCGENFLLKLQEKLNFDYDVSILTMNKHGSEQTGDNCEWFVSEEGIFYCILCDGMGSGVQAHDDSLQVTALFKTLTLSGFSAESALRIINGGMICDHRRERCISVDCVTVNLFTGKCDFIKAGAVVTLTKSKNTVDYIRDTALPLGVLEIETIPVRTVFIENDTYIVMMTDGVTDNIGDRRKGEECIGNLLKLIDVSSVKEMSDTIMMSAVAEGIPKDDMTVTAIKISGKD